jgi:phospholipase C
MQARDTKKKHAKSRRTPQRRTRAPGASSSSASLPPIGCVVVLMLENRSFDHLFGKWPGAAGLTAGPFSNRPQPAVPAGTDNVAIAAGQPGLFSVAQGQGPGHALDDANVQLYTTSVVVPGTTPAAVNDRGFVENYRAALAVDGFAEAGVDLTPVMQSFAPGQLPALTALAENFVLCDQWYSEVPGPTMPNRLYMHAATSAGWARNDWSVIFDSVTIYEQLQTHARSWAVYYSDQNEVAQFSRINTQSANFKLFESSFAADAAAGKLANYNFVIPRFAGSVTEGPVTTMHAPQDVRPGDQLVADVYSALRAGSQWSQGLLVVTFDEHGGYFDHATPATAVNPDGINSPAPGDAASFAPTFTFDRLGLRVPTLLASPYLPKGSVCSSPLQHTSILTTVRSLFRISGALTRRDAAAPGFQELFLSAPRTDAPPQLSAAQPFQALDALKAAPDDLMSEMARGWRSITATLPGAKRAIPTPSSQDATHRFLRNAVQAYLAYRAHQARTRSRKDGRSRRKAK